MKVAGFRNDALGAWMPPWMPAWMAPFADTLACIFSARMFDVIAVRDRKA